MNIYNCATKFRLNATRTLWIGKSGVLAKFGAKKANLKNKEEFSDMVAMLGAALPFDVETESAGVIVDFIHDSSSLRSVYEATVNSTSGNASLSLRNRARTVRLTPALLSPYSTTLRASA